MPVHVAQSSLSAGLDKLNASDAVAIRFVHAIHIIVLELFKSIIRITNADRFFILSLSCLLYTVIGTVPQVRMRAMKD